jgi:uncharacterized protein (TIGR00251 family)
VSALPFRSDDQGVVLYLRLTPGSHRREIGGLYCDAQGKVSLQVKVRAQPEKGKANEAAIDLLAETLNLHRKAFTITAGETSRLKTVRIAGNPALIGQKLETIIQDHTE